ncbi:unnamed protein product [Rotaria sordida]|uniref:Uncharacterized protein n=1 Tax=Rotaria sordida TaxID=392033 RepID=A0A814ELH5_9BILA|nr:unnamed protein product [Rotaria sordida]
MKQAAIDVLNVFMYYSYDKVGNANTIDDSITREAIDDPSHLLVSAKDGKLFVLTPEKKVILKNPLKK